MPFDQKINEDVTIFASIVRKLYNNKVITENKYRIVCKCIIQIIQAKNDEDMYTAYDNVKKIYKIHSWWSMYHFMKKNLIPPPKKSSRNRLIRNPNTRSRLGVMTC